MSGILPERHQVVNGFAGSSGTAAVSVVAAPSVGRLAITSLQLGRTDAAANATTVTLNDLKATQLVVPNPGSGGAISYVFDSPLMFSAFTAMTITSSSATAAVFAAAQGFVLE